MCTILSRSLCNLRVWLQIMVKHRIAHDQFSQLAVKLVKAAPPCMSSSDDWEPTLAALEELNLSLEHDNPAALTPLPDASAEQSSCMRALQNVVELLTSRTSTQFKCKRRCWSSTPHN